VNCFRCRKLPTSLVVIEICRRRGIFDHSEVQLQTH